MEYLRHGTHNSRIDSKTGMSKKYRFARINFCIKAHYNAYRCAVM
jgi:hypothetical protein